MFTQPWDDVVNGPVINYTQNQQQVITDRRYKEAVHIRNEGQHAMNRDEGSYQLSHAYDRFLDTSSFSRVKNRKNWVPASSDEGLWLRSKRQFR